MLIRRIESRDAEAILAIQSASPEIAQWAMRDYDRVARGEMAGWAAEESVEIAGFLVARQVVNELEILNLAVRPDMRRRGVATALLAEALDWGKSFRAETALLEVRASNSAALRLYERHGFAAIGRRRGYYAAPAEDALVLSLRLV